MQKGNRILFNAIEAFDNHSWIKTLVRSSTVFMYAVFLPFLFPRRIHIISGKPPMRAVYTAYFGYLEGIKTRVQPSNLTVCISTMKFISSTLIALALSALTAVAMPATSPANALEKRSEKCRIVADGARCRRTPSSNDIIGEFFTGNVCLFIV